MNNKGMYSTVILVVVFAFFLFIITSTLAQDTGYSPQNSVRALALETDIAYVKLDKLVDSFYNSSPAIGNKINLGNICFATVLEYSVESSMHTSRYLLECSRDDLNYIKEFNFIRTVSEGLVIDPQKNQENP